MAERTKAQMAAIIDALDVTEEGNALSPATLRQFKNAMTDMIDSAVTIADNDSPAASATASGIVELLTNAEALTGTDTLRAMTAANLRSLAAAIADLDTGTNLTKWLTSDAVRGSLYGIKYLVLEVVDSATDVATGDGAHFAHVPAAFNGMDIVSVHALNHVAGVTGQCDVQIANVTGAGDVLSTVLSIDTAEVGSDTGDTPAVIDTAEDDLATNDVLRIDVDAIHSGTAPKGLTVTIGCRIPGA